MTTLSVAVVLMIGGTTLAQGLPNGGVFLIVWATAGGVWKPALLEERYDDAI